MMAPVEKKTIEKWEKILWKIYNTEGKSNAADIQSKYDFYEINHHTIRKYFQDYVGQ